MGYSTADLSSQDFLLQVGLGKIPNARGILFQAHNPKLSTGSEKVVWGIDASYVFLQTPTPLFISSSDASDVGNTVIMRGLIGGFIEVIATVVTDGHNQVRIGPTLEWLRVNEAINDPVTSTLTAGDLFIAESDTLTNGVPDTTSKIKGVMRVADQRTQTGVYTVPAGKSILVIRLRGSTEKGTNALARFGIGGGAGSGLFVFNVPTPLYENVTNIEISGLGGFGETQDFVAVASTDNSVSRVTISGILLEFGKSTAPNLNTILPSSP